jgi:hypothetical protein
MNTPDTFIGRCKHCKTARRIGAPIVRTYIAELGYGRKERKTFRALPGGRTIEGHSRFYVDCEVCPVHPISGVRRMVEMNKIIGRKTEHRCGAKCLNSTGFVCDCSCGGANHGCGVQLECAH